MIEHVLIVRVSHVLHMEMDGAGNEGHLRLMCRLQRSP